MELDRRKLVAFGAAAAMWTVGTAAVVLLDPGLTAVAAGYYLVFTVAVASRRCSTGVAMTTAWVVAVLVVGGLMAWDGEVRGAVVAGGSLGTFLAAGWGATGFLLLLFIDPSRRRVDV